MGKQKTSKAVTAPYPGDISELRKTLIDTLTSRAWEKSPFYGQLERMYEGLLRSPTQLPSYLTSTVRSMVETGAPYDISKLYQAGVPVYERGLEKAIAQAKEQAGVGGGLRSAAGWEKMGQAAAESAERWNQYLAEQAMRGHEAAAARQMQAIPYAMEEAYYPMKLMQSLAPIASVIEQSEYPLLEEAMQMALTGVGQPARQTGYTPTFQAGCCFIFIEGNRLTDDIKTFRDTFFPKGCSVENGYRRMARWLVPIMARNWFVKKIVQTVMLNPISSAIEYYYKRNRHGWIYNPIGYFWKKVWEKLGR